MESKKWTEEWSHLWWGTNGELVIITPSEVDEDIRSAKKTICQEDDLLGAARCHKSGAAKGL